MFHSSSASISPSPAPSRSSLRFDPQPSTSCFSPPPSVLSASTFELSTLHCSALTPFVATLRNSTQLIEKSATLTPVFATLTQLVACKFFSCHSYTKSGGCRPPFGKPDGPHRRLSAFQSSNLSTFKPSNRVSGLSSFFSHCSEFFCTSQKNYLPCFQANPTSFCKTPGWEYRSRVFPRLRRTFPSPWAAALCSFTSLLPLPPLPLSTAPAPLPSPHTPRTTTGSPP
jgi:hypothetical protein